MGNRRFPKLNLQNNINKMISKEKLYVKTFSSLLTNLINDNYKILDETVSDYIIPMIFKARENPFTDILNNKRACQEFSRAVRRVAVLGPPFINEKYLNHVAYSVDMNVSDLPSKFTYRIVDDYGAFTNEIYLTVYNPLFYTTPSYFDTDGYMYDKYGLQHTSQFDMRAVASILQRRCVLNASAIKGIDPEHISARVNLVAKIFDRLAAGWTIENLSFASCVAKTDAMCPCCQEAITTEHVVLGCVCELAMHTMCLRKYCMSEMETHSYFRCPTCRDTLFFS
jgi:hypothetical protein